MKLMMMSSFTSSTLSANLDHVTPIPAGVTSSDLFVIPSQTACWRGGLWIYHRLFVKDFLACSDGSCALDVPSRDGVRCASAMIFLTLIDTWDVFLYVDLIKGCYLYAWIVVDNT